MHGAFVFARALLYFVLVLGSGWDFLRRMLHNWFFRKRRLLYRYRLS